MIYNEIGDNVKKIFRILLVLMYIVGNSLVFATTKEELKITSTAAIVMEQSTGRVLYEKNMRKRVKIASTTKILTAIVAIENGSLSDMVTVSKKAAGTGGSEVGIVAGSEVSLESLMYGMLLKSGNDCAVAIAEHIGGDVENFAKMMNKKAYEIGAKDTNCTNPHGLDTEDNYSTAYDLALIARYAKTNDTLSKMMATKSITVNFGKVPKYLANTNKLLSTYVYCDGGKTGFTNMANRCLVATAKKEDLEIVAIVLGANTTDIRFNECKELLKYGIENYKMVNINDKINWYIDIPIIKGNVYSYIRKFDADLTLPLKEGEIEEIYLSQSIVPILTAPVNRGTLLGNISLYIGEEELYKRNIYLDQEIKKNTVLDYIIKGFKSILLEEEMI